MDFREAKWESPSGPLDFCRAKWESVPPADFRKAKWESVPGPPAGGRGKPGLGGREALFPTQGLNGSNGNGHPASERCGGSLFIGTVDASDLLYLVCGLIQKLTPMRQDENASAVLDLVFCDLCKDDRLAAASR